MNVLQSMELKQFIVIQINLEKSVKPVVEYLAKSQHDTHSYFEQLDVERENYLRNLKRAVQEVIKQLKAKKQLFEENEAACITDFKQFKSEMVNIQENIYNLKCSTKLEYMDLKKSESELYQDLDYYNQKIFEWDQPTKHYLFNHIENIKPKINRSSHSCKEVKQFLDFLHCNGGHTNGWRREDHQLFLRLRPKYRNEDLVKHLHEVLPDISEENIRAHEDWYKKYISLENKKKEALRKWKINRATKTTVIPTLNYRFRINIEPEKGIRDKLIEWKEQKEQNLRALKEESEQREQRKRQAEEAKRKHQEEIKATVRQWKQINLDMEENMKREQVMKKEEEKRRRAVEANKLIKVFQTQDDIHLHKLKEMKKKVEKSQIRSKSCNIAKRDPNRLLKPTRQWINRVHDDSCYHGVPGIISVKSLPKLGIPEWRKAVK